MARLLTGSLKNSELFIFWMINKFIYKISNDKVHQSPLTQMYLISTKSSMPYFDPSRPIPDSLTPPNGPTSFEIAPKII